MREIGRHLLWPLAALAILLAFNALRDPAFFHLRLVEGRLTGAMIDILNQGAPVILLALGMTLVIGTGGIDLSVGAVMAVAGAVAADQLHSGAPTTAALAAAVGAGLAAGLWNGSLIALVGLSPIVATLILMVAGRGIAQLVSNGEIIDIAPDAAILAIGRGSLLGLPVPVLMALGAAAALAGVARLTSLGLFIECVGGNEQASRYAGLAVRSIRLAAYASLSKRRIDLEFAQETLGAAITRPREVITVDSVIKSVASYYGLKPSDIKSERRHKSVATPRAVAMYLSRHHTKDSYPDLARAFGGKHHTTVISAVQKIVERLKDDASLRSEIHAIESMILR